MCGVIGLIFERDRQDMGKVAAELLRMLEYRGYDSTGAAIQGSTTPVVLRKGVGAPSKVTGPLGIDALAGHVFCGQVRWATFGAVDDANAQPHEVRCHTHLYGAHNGNVTNCDDLQRWLRAEGHAVASDNDGEMLVHTVEHFFAKALADQPNDVLAPPVRLAAMRAAIQQASQAAVGSFAAVIADPITRTLWAIKAGSSLYFGTGEDPEHGRFCLASSDLSSVLRMTHQLIPITRGELVEFDANGYQVMRLSDLQPVDRPPVRSRLLAQDITLQPPFTTFMEQEIAAQVRTVGKVAEMFSGGSARLSRLRAHFEAVTPLDRSVVDAAIHTLRSQTTDAGLGHALGALLALPGFTRLSGAVGHIASAPYASSDAALLLDLDAHAEAQTLALIDAWIEWDEVSELTKSATRFAALCAEVQQRGGRIYVVCCGSSYHAARTAALFFNDIAGVQLMPLLPGDFRAQCSNSLQDGDLFIAVSQSGETKDLVDVMTTAGASGRQIARVSLVNNVNSTVAQELSDLVIPLHCGPEIAVPATKSFVNQIAAFFGLALAVAREQLQRGAPNDAFAEEAAARLAAKNRAFQRLPALIAETLAASDAAIRQAADLLFLEPSIQLLATRISPVAMEGALKIREVVLNHTEGFEGSEFKHGPNTILGVNTIYGPAELQRLLQAIDRAGLVGPTAALLDPTSAIPTETRAAILEALNSDYPIIYVSGPGDRDVQLTVAQMNTHKIRGARTVVIAEPNAALYQAATKAPQGASDYRSVFVALPPSGDAILTVFTATVALQRLALLMSTKKAAYLDALGVKGHGVHPDVPKNVSKSITVD